MKSFNLLFSLITTAILFTSNAFAGPVISGGGVGETNRHLSCANDELNFAILGTAAPSFIQGVLEDSSGSQATFKCVRPSQKSGANPATAGAIIWSCMQYPENDGSYSIRIERSGVTGMLSAYLLQKQIYPLSPKAVATMYCK